MMPDETTENMPVSRCRKFTLMDALILMAALALALALARMPLYYLGRNVSALPFRKMASWDNWTAKVVWQGTDPMSLLGWLYISVTPFLLFGSLAYVGVRLRRPRPSLREMARQPGMLAHEVLVVLVLLNIAVYLAAELLGTDPGSGPAVGTDPGIAWGRWRLVGILLLVAFAFGVPTAWLVQYRRGRTRPEAGWIDRLGRSLGVGWSVDFSLILAVNLFF